MTRLSGKIALVTGAAGGIGEAIAKRFCNDPAKPAQVRPLKQMLQRVFSFRGPDVADGCCRS